MNPASILWEAPPTATPARPKGTLRRAGEIAVRAILGASWEVDKKSPRAPPPRFKPSYSSSRSTYKDVRLLPGQLSSSSIREYPVPLAVEVID